MVTVTTGGSILGYSAHAQAAVADEADERHHEAHDRREDRAMDRDLGKLHALGSCGRNHGHRRAVADLELARRDHELAGRHPFDQLDAASRRVPIETLESCAFRRPP